MYGFTEECAEDFREQLKMDAYAEAAESMNYEKKMYSSEEFALQELGLADIIESMEDLAKQMTEYGYAYSVKTVMEQI